jgi:hypothetical protein
MSQNTHSSEQPRRISLASVALITRIRNRQVEWLLQWNESWKVMNLISGHKESSDLNNLTCMVREIHEELFEPLPARTLTKMQRALSGNDDVYAPSHSPWQDAHIERITRIGNGPYEFDDYSASARCRTHYVFHIYKVGFLSTLPLYYHNSFYSPCYPTPFNEWVCEQDIKSGRTASGRPISPTMARVLEYSDNTDSASTVH